MPELTKSQEIQQAYTDGTLLLHLLEFNMSNQPDKLENFFNVLSGKDGATFTNFAHNIEALAGEGFLGLATTSLKKGHPVKLYYHPTYYTGLGLLMNSNSPHVEPCYVSSIDAWSVTNGTQRTVTNPDPEPYPELRKTQNLPLSGAFNIDLINNRPKLVENARKALTQMWQSIETKEGILKPGAELNEVLVRAQSKGVKGIVIDEGPCEEPAVYGSKPVHIDKDTFKARVMDANKLNTWLMEKYPEDFPSPLPIFGYSKLATNQLVELTPEQLISGDMPDHGKMLWVKSESNPLSKHLDRNNEENRNRTR